MARTVEILRGKKASPTAEAILKAIAQSAEDAGHQVRLTSHYEGKSDWLVLFGAGAQAHDEARKLQVKTGRHALLFDLGYFGRKKLVGYVRMSINDDHPQKWLSKTEPEPSRWDAHGISIKDQYDPSGPVILVGLGRKSRAYLRDEAWEVRELARIRRQHPGREVVFRPKPGHPSPRLNCRADEQTPISDLLNGASLVVCRHSNVAIDAVVAGIPFEAIDGAAMWLRSKPYTRENRLDFLRRISWWQWMPEEAAQCWSFAQRMADD